MCKLLEDMCNDVAREVAEEVTREVSKEKTKEFVRNLLEGSFSTEQIAKFAAISQEEASALIKEIKEEK